MPSDDDCIFIEPNVQSPQSFWVNPKSSSYFDKVDYDIDSIVLVGNFGLQWLNPPWEFECRLDIQYATFLDDKKVCSKLYSSYHMIFMIVSYTFVPDVAFSAVAATASNSLQSFVDSIQNRRLSQGIHRRLLFGQTTQGNVSSVPVRWTIRSHFTSIIL